MPYPINTIPSSAGGRLVSLTDHNDGGASGELRLVGDGRGNGSACRCKEGFLDSRSVPARRQTFRAMTLLEMLVAIFISTLVLGGFSYMFFRSVQSNAFILEEGQTALANQRAVDNLVRDIRRARQADNGSYPVVAGSDFELTFYADADKDGQTERIHYFLDNGSLKKGVRLPTPGTPVTYAAGDATVATVATAVYNTNAEPIFTYYNAQYPGDAAHNPLSGPIAIADIRLVKVHIAMNIDPHHAPDSVNFESFAELRNLNEYVSP